MKYPYSCFSSGFCFLVFMFIFILSVLLLDAINCYYITLWKFFRIIIIIIIIVVFWLMNVGSSNKKTNHDMWGKRVIFTGTSIYKREAVRNKNIGLVARIRIQFTVVLASVIRSGCSLSRLIQTLPDTTGLSPHSLHLLFCWVLSILALIW